MYLQQLDSTPLDQVTDILIRAACEERAEEMIHLGGIAMSVDDFWREGALNTYKAAAAWWPTDAPMNCALPTLRELCMYIAAPSGAKLIPADAVLITLGERCAAWLTAEGRDVAHANETPVERRRRQTREAVQRSRALRRDATVDPEAARVRALHGAYIAACQARKAAAAEHDGLVEAAHAAWQEAKAALASPQDNASGETAVGGDDPQAVGDVG